MQSLVRGSHSGGIPEKYNKFRPAVMNEFPVPSGSWKEAYNKQQSKYNKQLALGVIAITVTLGYVFTKGGIDLVLTPPLK
jgi:hypothetical protein